MRKMFSSPTCHSPASCPESKSHAVIPWHFEWRSFPGWHRLVRETEFKRDVGCWVHAVSFTLHDQTLSKHVERFLEARQFGGAPGIEHPSAGAAVVVVMKLPAIYRADTIIMISCPFGKPA